jgi:hypothetical protein
LLSEVLENFDEHVVTELGAGVRVTTAIGQVDASALALARQAAHEVRTEMEREGAPVQEGRPP